MGISIRDEKGQAIVEYILVLVVTVGIVLGLMYQLNDAFKQWATNYFGNYLACLLETGELPTIGGSPGDSGVCNQFFEPFDIANGRKLIAGKDSSESEGKKQATQSTGETTRRGGGGSASSQGPSGPEFMGKGGAGAGGGGDSRNGGKSVDPTYTGNTQASNYGVSSSSRSTKTRVLLDQGFAFDNERQTARRRQISSLPQRGYLGGAGQKTAVHLKNRSGDNSGEEPSSGFTIGDFFKYLIIAAIVLAVVVFLGGQGLQIGKSME